MFFVTPWKQIKFSWNNFFSIQFLIRCIHHKKLKIFYNKYGLNYLFQLGFVFGGGGGGGEYGDGVEDSRKILIHKET